MAPAAAATAGARVANSPAMSYPRDMTSSGHADGVDASRGSADAPARWRWAELALIFAIFFVVGGAPAPHVNETHYLTKAKHYWDSSFCPGDFFLDSADPHVTFYWTFGWITRLVSLTATAWIGRVLAWLLMAFAWQRLSHAVTAAPWTAALSAGMWVMFIEHGNLAGEWAIGGIEAKCFAYGFVLLGLAALANGDWRWPWIWFGLASAFHVLVGAWAVLAAIAVWLFEPRDERTSFAKILPSLMLGGVLSLPGLLAALALERGTEPSIAAEAARIYVFERLPHHLAPLSLPASEQRARFTRFGLMTALFAALWLWFRLRAHTHNVEATEPNAGALRRLLDFAAFALAANCVGLTIEAALGNKPIVAARVLRYYWFRQADIAVPMATALAIARLVASPALAEKRRALLAAIPIAAVVWFLSGVTWKRIDEPRPPAVARLERYHDWQDACDWISRHAPADAVFLVPRAGHSFKWYASRADVANYKDVPQDAASVVEWRARLAALFPVVEGVSGEPKTLGSPEQLGTRRVRELAKQYGATHVIARTYPPLDLQVVYPRESAPYSYYTVYELRRTEAGERQ
jgi:hypothetical protein